jgi:hypothetical protein
MVREMTISRSEAVCPLEPRTDPGMGVDAEGAEG